MPKVIDITECQLEWRDINSRRLHPRPVLSRYKGVHVSGVIKQVAVKLGKLTPADEIDFMPQVVALGVMFEEFAAGLYPNMIWQPGQLVRQGIAGNPDGKERKVIDGLGVMKLWANHEFKATNKSSRTRQDITQEWMWMEQIKTYINLDPDMSQQVEDLGFGLSYLHVWWNNWDYTHPLKPKYLRYLIQFFRPELKNNWAMMQRYKLQTQKEG